MYIRNDLSADFSDAILVRAEAGLDLSNRYLNLLILSTRNKHIEIFNDGYGKPVGYLAWSKISKDTLRMMSLYNGNIKYPYERNDGCIFLLNDMVFTQKHNAKFKEHWLCFIRKLTAFIVIRKNRVVLYKKTQGKHRGKILFRLKTV